MIFRVGDWVEIDRPDKPWFHGQVAEIVEVIFSSSNERLNTFGLAISKTPGFKTTRWQAVYLKPLQPSNAEDYYA